MGRFLLPSVIGLLGLASFSADCRAQSLPGWTIVWADEFAQADGTAPETANWSHETGGSGWGNNELQHYTSRSENSRVEDGKLVIEARAENFGGKNYTSARLVSKNKWSWTHGRIEARIKVPAGRGIWPAFWTLGTNIDSVGWPACGEIDILENIGSEPSILHGTLHGPGYSGGNGISGSYTLPGATLAEDFHVFAVEWEAGRIRWLMDGQQYFTLTPADLPGGGAWVFEQPQFLILNVAVGGNWPGSPDGSTMFPQRMTVDYVRVYKPAADGASVTSVLENPGFETAGPAGWIGFGRDVPVPTGTARNGANSVKAYGLFSGAANESGAYQEAPASPGESYTAGVWIFTPPADKIAGENTAFAEVSFRDAGSNVLALHRTALINRDSAAGVWQNLAVIHRLNPADGAVIGTNAALLAPAGTTSVRARMVFRQPAIAGGSVFFDDLTLAEGMAPVTAPPVTVTVDPAAPWLGYLNVADLPADGGAFRFGSPWGVADLRAGFAGSVVTLTPNTIGDPAPYWYVGGGAPGHPGNKTIEANLYVEATGPLSGKTVVFTGNVLSNTLTAAHATVAFIKDFAPDYSSHTLVTAPLSGGNFSISLTTASGPGRHVQYGFRTTGPNVWATDVDPFGAVRITGTGVVSYAEWIAGFDFSAYPNPNLTPAGDPDGDGRDNLTEYALDGAPADGAEIGKLRHLLAEIDGGGPYFSITFPVLANAAFAGSPAMSAVVGPVNYTVEGSDDLILFNREITEVPAAAAGMPPLAAGWTYRTFRLNGIVGGTTPRSPAGFLRVRVSGAP